MPGVLGEIVRDVELELSAEEVGLGSVHSGEGVLGAGARDGEAGIALRIMGS